MKRLILLMAGAALAAVPAIAGLNGNPALSQQVPVRVPSHAVPVRAVDVVPDKGSDDGRRDSDDSASPSSRAEPEADRGRGAQAGEDRGGPGPAVTSGRHAEPGHEGAPAANRGRPAAGPAEPNDDRTRTAHAGRDGGGHGSDHRSGHG